MAAFCLLEVSSQKKGDEYRLLAKLVKKIEIVRIKIACKVKLSALANRFTNTDGLTLYGGHYVIIQLVQKGCLSTNVNETRVVKQMRGSET